jgi:opacity protein-like surface antigen
MGSFKNYALAGILALAASTTAHAADLPAPPPPMPYVPVEVGGGWYLRGDIGMTNQDVDKLSFGNTDPDFETLHLDFDSSPLVGLGVGYQFNHWIRADITGEYRGKASFHGLDRTRDLTPGSFYTNEYRGTKAEWVGLANVYLDLGTWYGLTPFVGVGVGFAHNTIDNYMDINTVNGSVAYAGDDAQTEFAWALHAGVAYDVTPNFKVEFAYRYLDLGDAQTARVARTDGGACSVCAPMKFKDIDSHDFKIGLRWMLGAPVLAAMAPPPPVMRRF